MGLQNVQNSILSSTFTMVWSRVMFRTIYWRRLATAPPNSTLQILSLWSLWSLCPVASVYISINSGPVIGLRPRFRLEGSDWDGLWCNAWRSLRVPWHWSTEQKCIGNSHSKTFFGATVLTQYVANISKLNRPNPASFTWTRASTSTHLGTSNSESGICTTGMI